MRRKSRADLIELINERLDEIRREASQEQTHAIREVQQLVVGISEAEDSRTDDRDGLS